RRAWSRSGPIPPRSRTGRSSSRCEAMLSASLGRADMPRFRPLPHLTWVDPSSALDVDRAIRARLAEARRFFHQFQWTTGGFLHRPSIEYPRVGLADSRWIGFYPAGATQFECEIQDAISLLLVFPDPSISDLLPPAVSRVGAARGYVDR